MISIDTIFEDKDFVKKVIISHRRARAIGAAKGKAEGEVEGKTASQIQMMRKMKELGLATELIARVIDWPIYEMDDLSIYQLQGKVYKSKL